MSKQASSERVRVFTFESPLGPIYGAVSEKGLMHLTIPNKDLRDFATSLDKLAPGAESHAVEPRETRAGRLLDALFAGKRPDLALPLDLRGRSDFSRAVLEELLNIPMGEVRTYGQVAAAVGRPKAARAVGRAVGANPIPIFIPCHRVVGANGSLTGFGSGLDTKRALLALERGGGLFPKGSGA